jgi:hypothetical protein
MSLKIHCLMIFATLTVACDGIDDSEQHSFNERDLAIGMDASDELLDEIAEPEQPFDGDDIPVTEFDAAGAGRGAIRDGAMNSDPPEGFAKEPRDLSIGKTPPTAYSYCSGYGCDGLDPHDTGCDLEAYRVGNPITIDIPWTAKNAVVEQFYSYKCDARWTRITSTSYGYSIKTNVRIKRNIKGAISAKTYPTNTSSYFSSYINWSDMLHCPRNTCTAESFGKVLHDNAVYSAATLWLQ